MFEKAARSKLRFSTTKGPLSVEDLWDLSVEDLDSIFKAQNARLKSSQEESLLGKKTKDDEVATLKVGIVRHIVEVKLAEADARFTAKAKADQKQKLLGILANKQDADLQGKSTAEIQAMIDAL
jgi:hypothetical protein